MSYTFVRAANFRPGPSPVRAIDLIVLHTMESPERVRTALNVAMWFAGDDAPMTSAHYCIDALEVIQCVLEEDIAWHARGANERSIGLEHAGRASQSSLEWKDHYSMATLLRSIELSAEICRRWSIPAEYVGVQGLKAGARGITTHADVSRAFGKSTHTDPGPGFPLAWYVERVAARLKEAA